MCLSLLTIIHPPLDVGSTEQLALAVLGGDGGILVGLIPYSIFLHFNLFPSTERGGDENLLPSLFPRWGQKSICTSKSSSVLLWEISLVITILVLFIFIVQWNDQLSLDRSIQGLKRINCNICNSQGKAKLITENINFWCCQLRGNSPLILKAQRLISSKYLPALKTTWIQA